MRHVARGGEGRWVTAPGAAANFEATPASQMETAAGWRFWDVLGMFVSEGGNSRSPVVMLIVHYFQTTLYVFEIVRVLSTLCIIMHGMAVSIAYYFMHVCFACLCLCSDLSLFVCQVI